VPASASAVANPIAAILIAVFLSRCGPRKSGQAARRSRSSHYDFDSLVHRLATERRGDMPETGRSLRAQFGALAFFVRFATVFAFGASRLRAPPQGSAGGWSGIFRSELWYALSAALSA
jgi:hypothetical protein